MKSVVFTCLAAVLSLHVASASSVAFGSGPIRTTAQGQVQGLLEKSTESYLGIPFAAPPVGPRRWQPPGAPSNWTGVRQATSFGNSCFQGHDAFTFATNVSEDCLYLNVYVPSKPSKAGPLPVRDLPCPGAP